MTTIVNDPAENDLRIEYHVHVFSRFVDIVSLHGSFDLPGALEDGPLGCDFYRSFCNGIFQHCIIEAASTIFGDFREKMRKGTSTNKAPDSTDHAPPGAMPLHDGIHQDDFRTETSIKIFGRNITIWSRGGDFTIPGGLMPALCDQYVNNFHQHLKTFGIWPASVALNDFFNDRRSAYEREKKKQAEATYVERVSWNFGSENLTQAVEELAEREAA